MLINSGTNGFVLNGVHDVTIRGFAIQNVTSTGIVISNSSDITIDHDFVGLYTPTGAGDGIDVSGSSSNVTISRSTVGTDANNISIGPGVTGTDVAENILPSGGYGNGVLVNGAANTDVVNNTAAFSYCPKPVFAVTGGATGTSLENNVILAQCTMGSPLLSVDPNSTVSTKWDYNAVDDNFDDASYFWGGVAYGQATGLAAATGQATHDSNATLTLGTGYVPQSGGPAVDSADANAPGVLPTDYNGNSRVDDPNTANTGTGIGYVDRGAVELQDPLTVSVSLNTYRAPTGGTVVATVTGNAGWGPITGYTVDFGDGTKPTSSSSPTISHVYTATQDAPYRITATVTDSLGNTATVVEPYYRGVEVVAPAPLAPVLSVSVDPRNSMHFDADLERSTDSWSIESGTCDFGDGSGVQTTAQGVVCDHVYTTPGIYRITMTLTDSAGNTAGASTLVVARPLPVVAPGPGRHCPTCY